MPGKQVVHLPFAGAVPGRQPLEGVRLVRGVVVDVRPWMVGEPRGRPVDELFEGAFLPGAVVRPERAEDLRIRAIRAIRRLLAV